MHIDDGLCSFVFTLQKLSTLRESREKINLREFVGSPPHSFESFSISRKLSVQRERERERNCRR